MRPAPQNQHHKTGTIEPVTDGPVPNFFGHLEATVMEILWRCGSANVRDVVDHLDRPLAYTTVMTTLDRLFKKGLLDRRKQDRAFIYAPRLSRRDWGLKHADLLISHLVETAGEHDQALLGELEKKIRLKRKELGRRRT